MGWICSVFYNFSHLFPFTFVLLLHREHKGMIGVLTLAYTWGNKISLSWSVALPCFGFFPWGKLTWIWYIEVWLCTMYYHMVLFLKRGNYWVYKVLPSCDKKICKNMSLFSPSWFIDYANFCMNNLRVKSVKGNNTTVIFNKNMLQSVSIQIFATYYFCCMILLIIKIS